MVLRYAVKNNFVHAAMCLVDRHKCQTLSANISIGDQPRSIDRTVVDLRCAVKNNFVRTAMCLVIWHNCETLSAHSFHCCQPRQIDVTIVRLGCGVIFSMMFTTVLQIFHYIHAAKWAMIVC